MNIFKRFPALKPALFCIAALFVFGGSVNYGAFDFIPALPFLAFVVYAALNWRKWYAPAAVVLVLACTGLYCLKKEHGVLFHPALGRTFVLAEDACLRLYQYKEESFALANAEPTCRTRPMKDAVKAQALPKGTRLTVDRVTVDNGEFGERYVITARTVLSERTRFPLQLIQWQDGAPARESDLRRAVFYDAALLMYWPVAPVLLSGLWKNLPQ